MTHSIVAELPDHFQAISVHDGGRVLLTVDHGHRSIGSITRMVSGQYATRTHRETLANENWAHAGYDVSTAVWHLYARHSRQIADWAEAHTIA